MNSNSKFRKHRRPLVAAGLIAVSTSLVLAGCSSSGTPSTSDSSGAAKGDIALTFLNQSRGQEAALNQLAQQYTAQTGVKITIDSPGPADFLPKLQARAQSNTMPDIYSSFNATDMAAFYKAGWAMDLTSELNAGWSKNFTPATLQMSKFEEGNNLGVKPGIYTVHWETQTYGFMVNPKLAGFTQDKAPKTSTEFIKALQNGKASSGSFSVAASLTPQLIQGIASNWLTDDQIADTFNGKASWNQPGWRNAFQFLVDLKDAGVIANGALPGGSDDNPTIENNFFTQQLAVAFDASPGVSVGLRTNPEFDDYFSIGLPSFDGAPQSPRSAGLPGKGAVINPKGAHPDEALKFVKWLTDAPHQAVFAKVGRILPTNPELLSGSDIPQQLAGFATGVTSMQVMSATFKTDVKTAIVAESQKLVLGETTIDKSLAAIQAAQDRTK